MSEKVVRLGVVRDNGYLYFIDGKGNVCRKLRQKDASSEVVVAEAFTRDNRYLYFLDKDGDVSRSLRKGKQVEQEQAAVAEVP